MRKDLVTHLVFTIAFFVLATFLQGFMDVRFYPFWIGALIGMLLPDVDYLIYIYALKPEKEISREAADLIQKRSVLKTWDLLATTRPQHTDLIFHSALFQLIFIIFTFLIVTSSGSLFGMGIVLSFSLHLLIDQVTDFMESGTIKNWFTGLNVAMSQSGEKWYMGGILVALLLFGFVF